MDFDFFSLDGFQELLHRRGVSVCPLPVLFCPTFAVLPHYHVRKSACYMPRRFFSHFCPVARIGRQAFYYGLKVYVNYLGHFLLFSEVFELQHVFALLRHVYSRWATIHSVTVLLMSF